WRRESTSPKQVLFLGCLTVCMLLLSPVCHLHYFCLCIPLVMGLVHLHGERSGTKLAGVALGIPFAVNVVLNALPQFQGMEFGRDVGFAMYGALLLWVIAVCVLRFTADNSSTVSEARPMVRAA